MERAWRIVTGKGMKSDFNQLTVPHACRSHFMKNVRNLCKAHSRHSRFATYAISLLLNAIYWEEFAYIFESLAIVLLSRHKNNLFLQHAEKLHKAIDNIGNKSFDFRQNESKDDKPDFATEEEDRSISFVATEAEFFNMIPSPFKSFFNDQTAKIKQAISREEMSEQLPLPDNPDCNEELYCKLLKDLLPTCILWSSILLGDLSRYRYNQDKSYADYRTEISALPKTTGHAEQSMGVMKNIQLGTRKLNRVDEFIAVLAHDLKGIERSHNDQSTRVSGRKKRSLSSCTETDTVPSSVSISSPLVKNEQDVSSYSSVKSVRPSSTVTIKEEWNKKTNRKKVGFYQRAPKKNPLGYIQKEKGQITQIRGMENGLNNCWFNSVIQTVLRINQLRTVLEEYDSIPCLTDNNIKNKAFEEVFKLLKRLLMSDESTITINELSRALYAVGNACHFSVGHQQDAHEFIVSLIVPFLQSCGLGKICDGTWQVQKTCISCQTTTLTIEHENVWTLMIPRVKDQRISIQDIVVRQLKHTEKIKSKCNKCPSQTAELSRDILHCPDILILHVQRSTGLTTDSGHMLKLNSRVHLLDNISVDTGKSVSNYDLISVIRHHGNFANLGHYTSVIKKEDRFIVIDDHHVRHLVDNDSSQNDSDRSAYIAIYSKTLEMGAPSELSNTVNNDLISSSALQSENDDMQGLDFKTMKELVKVGLHEMQQQNVDVAINVLCRDECLNCKTWVSDYVDILPFFEHFKSLDKSVESIVRSHDIMKGKICKCDREQVVRNYKIATTANGIVGIIYDKTSVNVEDSLKACSKEFGMRSYKLRFVTMFDGSSIIKYQRVGKQTFMEDGDQKSNTKVDISELNGILQGRNVLLTYNATQTNATFLKIGITDNPDQVGVFPMLHYGFNTEILELYPSVHNDILPQSHEVGKYRLQKRDLSILTSDSWFNDVLIDAYLNLVKESVTSSNDLLLMEACWAGIKITCDRSPNWYAREARHLNKKRNWARRRLVFLPLSYSQHWVLLVLEPNSFILTIMDPMGGASNATIMAANRAIYLCEYLRAMRTDIDSIDLHANISRWEVVVRRDFPTQNDAYNCGTFICMYARSVMKGKRLTFHSNACTLAGIRGVMLRELLEKELLPL